MQDVVFSIQEVPDPMYQREGDDLIIRAALPLTEALSESKVDVPAIDGRTLRVPLKEVRPPFYIG